MNNVVMRAWVFSQNYLASVEEKHLAEIESRLQVMQATHLKCRESWFSKDKKEINPAVDLTESTLPGDAVLQTVCRRDIWTIPKHGMAHTITVPLKCDGALHAKLLCCM